jgi:hypothetical protein
VAQPETYNYNFASMLIDIEKFYKREVAEAMFFGYVNGLVLNFPGISVEKAIENFQKYHKIDQELMNSETARKTYFRMQKEYFEVQKTK